MRKRTKISISAFIVFVVLMLAGTIAVAAQGPGANKGGEVTPKGDARGHPQTIRQLEEQECMADKQQKLSERSEEQIRKQKEEARGDTHRNEERVRTQTERVEALGQRQKDPDDTQTRDRLRDGARSSSTASAQERARALAVE